MTPSQTYAERVSEQLTQYASGEEIHDLPAIFHHWSDTYLRPKIEHTFGVSRISSFFAQPLVALSRERQSPLRILSVGSGDSSVELEIALEMRAAGVEDFVFVTTELSEDLVAEGRTRLAAAGMLSHFDCRVVDLNAWEPDEAFAAAMAHHSLHHIVELERVFRLVQAHLLDDGIFLVADMIGRNGHMRWPETLATVERLWAVLPDEKKYNHQLHRLDLEFTNFDCANEGFEGVRAQDILPLLNVYFYPGRFLGWGGIVDIFVDRAYGPNFDHTCDADRAMIELIEHINDRLLAAGGVKPTQMLAEFFKSPPPSGAPLCGDARDAVRWPTLLPDEARRN